MMDINKQIYKGLISQGLSPVQIDEGDIFYLIDLYFEGKEEKQESIVYADQVPWL